MSLQNTHIKRLKLMEMQLQLDQDNTRNAILIAQANLQKKRRKKQNDKEASAGMQLGYKSVLFILHFHLAGMNRGEPGRTVAPPWRTGKNRSVTGVLPAWTWVNRGEPAREPG